MAQGEARGEPGTLDVEVETTHHGAEDLVVTVRERVANDERGSTSAQGGFVDHRREALLGLREHRQRVVAVHRHRGTGGYEGVARGARSVIGAGC